MSRYSIALFLHIVGALGVFVALGLEWTSMLGLRRAASVEQARTWMTVMRSPQRVGGPSMLTLIVTGIYLTTSLGGMQPWLEFGILGLILLIVLGATLTRPRGVALGKALAAESGTLSATFQDRLRDPVLALSLNTRTAVALGVVFLMTVKPAAGAAVSVLGVSVALGLLSAFPAFGRRGSTQELA